MNINHQKFMIKSAAPLIHHTLQSNAHINKLLPLLRFDMTKLQIHRSPCNYYKGDIYVISSEKDEKDSKIDGIIKKLEKADIIGFDTEAAVNFNGHVEPNPTALVQLATENEILLWRLRKKGKFLNRKFPKRLQNILQDTNIRKVGTGNDKDLSDLDNFYNVKISNMVDNQLVAKDLGITRLGLASMSAQLFGWSVSKKYQLSNWEANDLEFGQVRYAATDAWASLLVYKKLESFVRALSQNDPKILPSAFEKNLLKESQIDKKIFKSIDDKVFANDALYRHTIRSLHLHKQKRLANRKLQKVNISIDDLDLDFIFTSLRKEISNKQYSQDDIDIKSYENYRDLLFYYVTSESRQLPYLFHSLVEDTEEPSPT